MRISISRRSMIVAASIKFGPEVFDYVAIGRALLCDLT